MQGICGFAYGASGPREPPAPSPSLLWGLSATAIAVVRVQAELASFHDLQYCKTDLIASKGVVFCKYTKSSSALLAMEAVQETGMVGSWSGVCFNKLARLRLAGQFFAACKLTCHPASRAQQYCLRVQWRSHGRPFTALHSRDA